MEKDSGLKRVKTIKFKAMIKASNKVGKPFEIVVNGVKMTIVAKKSKSLQGSPCDLCDMRDVVKMVKGGVAPRNCLHVVPSCFAHQREDHTSVIYKQVKN